MTATAERHTNEYGVTLIHYPNGRTVAPCQFCDDDCYGDPCDQRRAAAERVRSYWNNTVSAFLATR